MTCVNCQNKIEKALNNADGIIRANVSYSYGTADVIYDETKISRKEIIDVIEGLDYEVTQKTMPAGSDISNMICMLVIIVALYVICQSLGILNLLVPSRLADTGMGYPL